LDNNDFDSVHGTKNPQILPWYDGNNFAIRPIFNTTRALPSFWIWDRDLIGSMYRPVDSTNRFDYSSSITVDRLAAIPGEIVERKTNYKTLLLIKPLARVVINGSDDDYPAVITNKCDFESIPIFFGGANNSHPGISLSRLLNAGNNHSLYTINTIARGSNIDDKMNVTYSWLSNLTPLNTMWRMIGTHIRIGWSNVDNLNDTTKYDVTVTGFSNPSDVLGVYTRTDNLIRNSESLIFNLMSSAAGNTNKYGFYVTRVDITVKNVQQNYDYQNKNRVSISVGIVGDTCAITGAQYGNNTYLSNTNTTVGFSVAGGNLGIGNLNLRGTFVFFSTELKYRQFGVILGSKNVISNPSIAGTLLTEYTMSNLLWDSNGGIFNASGVRSVGSELELFNQVYGDVIVRPVLNDILGFSVGISVLVDNIDSTNITSFGIRFSLPNVIADSATILEVARRVSVMVLPTLKGRSTNTRSSYGPNESRLKNSVIGSITYDSPLNKGQGPRLSPAIMQLIRSPTSGGVDFAWGNPVYASNKSPIAIYRSILASSPSTTIILNSRIQFQGASGLTNFFRFFYPNGAQQTLIPTGSAIVQPTSGSIRIELNGSLNGNTPAFGINKFLLDSSNTISPYATLNATTIPNVVFLSTLLFTSDNKMIKEIRFAGESLFGNLKSVVNSDIHFTLRSIKSTAGNGIFESHLDPNKTVPYNGAIYVNFNSRINPLVRATALDFATVLHSKKSVGATLLPSEKIANYQEISLRNVMEIDDITLSNYWNLGTLIISTTLISTSTWTTISNFNFGTGIVSSLRTSSILIPKREYALSIYMEPIFRQDVSVQSPYLLYVDKSSAISYYTFLAGTSNFMEQRSSCSDYELIRNVYFIGEGNTPLYILVHYF
jgi:hypothetical protein